MKNKFIVLALAMAMVVSMLTGCGNSTTDNSSSTPAESSKTEESSKAEESVAQESSAAEESVAQESSAEAGAPAGEGTEIKIWVAENVTNLTQEYCDKFFAENPDYAGYYVTIEAVGEDKSSGNMITDVEAGADIYGFPQDATAKLVAAGALAPITDDYATEIAENNDEGSLTAAKVGDTIYAFPYTSDNGYFLYYDKSVVTDPSTLEGILAACEAAGKSFYFQINSGWYDVAFFFGAGATCTYTTDSEGNFVECNCDYGTKGLAGLKGMIQMASSSAFVAGSSVSDATNCAAIVDGTWDSGAAQDLFGENYACAKLPTFNVDGTDYQMGGFSGNKLMGIKPQTDADKFNVCKALASYLTSEEVQLARFELVGWGPSNKAAQASEAVQANEALAALAEQMAYNVPQGQYPDNYWSITEALGNSIVADEFDGLSDEDLTAYLATLQADLEALAQ